VNLGDQVIYAHRLSRSTANETNVSVNSEATRKYINEGVREFAKSTTGAPKEDYLQLVPRFDTKTWWAIRLTITGATHSLAATDISVTGTNRANTTGAQVAADLQVAIRAAIDPGANTTVVFNTTGPDIWKFTIDSIDGTDIEIVGPSGINYTDATDTLFAKSGTSGAQTWVSNIPQDSMVETDLPSDFLRMTNVEWDKESLDVAPFDIFSSPQTHGTPRYYGVKGDKIRLYPSPASQFEFHIWYKGQEADLTETDTTDDATTSPLPASVHMAPVYYAAAKLCEEKHEFAKAVQYMRNFFSIVREYRLRESNANWALWPSEQTIYQPPKVISST
jgi:hypothetical protein